MGTNVVGWSGTCLFWSKRVVEKCCEHGASNNRQVSAQGVSDQKICAPEITIVRTICKANQLKINCQARDTSSSSIFVGICARSVVSCVRSAHAGKAAKEDWERAIRHYFHLGGHCLLHVFLHLFSKYIQILSETGQKHLFVTKPAKHHENYIKQLCMKAVWLYRASGSWAPLGAPSVLQFVFEN